MVCKPDTELIRFTSPLRMARVSGTNCHLPSSQSPSCLLHQLMFLTILSQWHVTTEVDRWLLAEEGAGPCCGQPGVIFPRSDLLAYLPQQWFARGACQRTRKSWHLHLHQRATGFLWGTLITPRSLTCWDTYHPSVTWKTEVSPWHKADLSLENLYTSWETSSPPVNFVCDLTHVRPYPESCDTVKQYMSTQNVQYIHT